MSPSLTVLLCGLSFLAGFLTRRRADWIRDFKAKKHAAHNTLLRETVTRLWTDSQRKGRAA